MVSETVSLRCEDAIAFVQLNRPDKRNAISSAVLHELDAVCERIENDATVAVVLLTGAGTVFCAGGDLAEVEGLAGPGGDWEPFGRLWHRVFNRIEALPVPVIAAVQGAALAGGLELALVADLVIAEDGARIGDQHANVGFVAGGGASQRLPRLIGERRAKELIYLGGWLTAQEAWAWGLVNRVARPGELMTEALALARAVAAKSREGNRIIKNLVSLAADTALHDGLEAEITAVAGYMRSEEVAARLARFRAGMAPSA